MPRPVFYALAVASVGGPLALVTVFLPNELAGVPSSSSAIVFFGAAAFLFPTFVWYRFARDMASSAGLYTFVEAAAGPLVARLHGLAWVVSYFLYLPSTIAFVFYGLLPVAFPGMGAAKPLLEVGVPVAMVMGLAFWRLGLYSVTALVAGAQVVLVAVLAGMEISRGSSPGSGAVHLVNLTAPGGTAVRAIGSASLLFVCASLPLYLGTEVRRARETTARALPLSVVVAATAAVAGAAGYALFSPDVLDGEFPGWSMALSLGGRGFADLVAVGTALSILTLVLLEYVALTRLLPVMAAPFATPARAELAVGLAFVASAGLGLLGPDKTYEKLANPALIALYVSQLFVFLVYPRYRRARGRLRSYDVLAAAAGFALMLYGLYTALKPSTGL